MSSSRSPSGSLELSQISHAPVIRGPRDLLKLSLGALGVVYGDIGTSPLYAIKECFGAEYGVTPTLANVLGVLSLVFWALTLVVVVKYIVFVLRADNHGDGGILALLAQVTEQRSHPQRGETGRKRHLLLLSLALFGAALLLADGMITPAISVLGALEGLDVATPFFQPYVVPLALVILGGLFLLQRRGTEGIGVLFGPAMIVWFGSIAVLGIPAIVRHPVVLTALDPSHAVRFFAANGLQGFLILGAVVLCVTGSEALYADMGHFGRKPIRFTWFAVVFPALLLNYFGQGALLVGAGDRRIDNPFYELAPGFFLYPLVLIATVAAVIASQAMISGAFSLAQQAVHLGYLPRLSIIHTSERARGQIYVPEVNTLLMFACMALVVSFRSTSNLAAAYGIAVMGTMVSTSVLMFALMIRRWKWPVWRATALAGLFLAVEIPFLSANFPKIVHGGWFPLVIGALFFAVMTTWKRGRAALRRQLEASTLPIEQFVADLPVRKPHRVKGTAVFMTSAMGGAPPILLHHFKHNKVLHERVLLLTIVTEGVPQVPKGDRVRVRALGEGFFEVIAHYGFMQTPNVPEVLRRCGEQGLQVPIETVSYYLGRETLLTTGRSGLPIWRKKLFAFLTRNARPANAFYRIPPNRVVELGAQVEL